MSDQYPSIHYTNVHEICYLKDMEHHQKQDQSQKFNSDRQVFSSIADKLYKKIVQQGYIEKAKQFAIPQTHKKVETMYDLSDNWIDDEEAFTEAENEKTSNQFSKYKALSGIPIEEFYKNQITKSPPKFHIKNEKPRHVNSKLNVNDILTNQLTVVKYNDLKKTIQLDLKEGRTSNPDGHQKNRDYFIID